MSTPTQPAAAAPPVAPIRRKVAAPSPSPAEQTEPTRPPLEVLKDIQEATKPPLEAALSRLKATREKNVEMALRVYREHVAGLADDKRLSQGEMDALSHALHQLDLTADHVKADALAIRQHREQIQLADRAKKIEDELLSQAPGWAEEERRIRARIAELNGERCRLQQASMVAGQHQQAAVQKARDHIRVLGSLPEALAAATAPPPGPYVPKVIRSGDGAPKTAEGLLAVHKAIGLEVPAELMQGAG